MSSTTYQTIATTDPINDDTAGEEQSVPANASCCKPESIDWFWAYLKGGSLSDAEKVALRERMESMKGVENVETLEIHAESVRQIAYVLFWIKIMFAVIFTKSMVDPTILQYSDLKAMFGYNNICVLFDYSPSREYTAMIYPLFEYTFFFYVVLDYIHLRLVCKGDNNLQGLLTMGNIALPFKLLFIAWFRMIFVYNVQQPYVPYGVRGVVGHTMAFFGLQLSLIMVAFENIMFIWKTGIAFPRLGLVWTRRLSLVYLGLFVLNTTFQMWFAFGIFWGYDTLDVRGENPNRNHQLIILLVDRSWLFLVGVMPIYFAQIGRKTQSHVRFTMELNSDAWEGFVDVTERTVSKRSVAAI